MVVKIVITESVDDKIATTSHVVTDDLLSCCSDSQIGKYLRAVIEQHKK